MSTGEDVMQGNYFASHWRSPLAKHIGLHASFDHCVSGRPALWESRVLVISRKKFRAARTVGGEQYVTTH